MFLKPLWNLLCATNIYHHKRELASGYPRYGSVWINVYDCVCCGKYRIESDEYTVYNPYRNSIKWPIDKSVLIRFNGFDEDVLFVPSNGTYSIVPCV